MAPDPARPRRLLRLTSPHTRGDDVKVLQRALGVRDDGEYGPVTAAAARRRGHALGVLESTLAKGCTVQTQRIIRDPKKYQTDAQKKRARERKAETVGKGGDAAVKWARSKIGIHEKPQGSNGDRGGPIDKWQAEALMGRGPWCGAFAKASAAAGGAIVTPEARYVPWLEAHARAHTGGYRGWASASDIAAMVEQAVPGDHVCFDFGGGGDAGVNDHVAVLVKFYRDASGLWRVKCIDGNTSGTSPADGGMVAESDRPIRFVAGVAKVRWPA